MATDTIMGPVHPGEILLEEFLKPLPVSQYPPGEGDRGARDRTRTARRGCLEPVQVAGARVSPGDLVVADASGVV